MLWNERILLTSSCSLAMCGIRLLELLGKLPRYAWYCARSLWVFKRPLEVIRLYLSKRPPRDRLLHLRPGRLLFLSDHPHDIVTAFVVFAKRDYGTVRPGSVVVDIGANIGTYTIFAVCMGATRVLSYEPNSSAFKVLTENITHNGFSTVVQARQLAVSSVDGEQVKIPLESSPYNQIARAGLMTAGVELVGSISLESIMNDHVGGVADLVKIDCEGAEYEILGMANEEVLHKIGHLRLEYHDGPIKELVKHLEKCGHRLVRIKRDSAVMWFENTRWRQIRKRHR